MWKYRIKAPIFYQIVDDPVHFENEDVAFAKECELYVSFIVSGDFEWIDKSGMNVIRKLFCENDLTLEKKTF